MRHNTLYTVLFATGVCVVCGVLVSTSAVSLLERQQVNVALEKKQNVLLAAGLTETGETLSAEEVERRFAGIEAQVIKLSSGEEVKELDPATFNQRREAADPNLSREAPPNRAQVSRLPEHALIYQVRNEAGQVEMIVLPVEGYGLWSTLYGFLALDADTTTVRGLTFYQHKETPGLGGEVDNPRWKALWPGRRALDENWQPQISVMKGRAGSPGDDPYRVDGLSGASITSRGVTNLLQFWLGADGFGPYLERFRQRGEEAG